jgi:hypothetical protein
VPFAASVPSGLARFLLVIGGFLGSLPSASFYSLCIFEGVEIGLSKADRSPDFDKCDFAVVNKLLKGSLPKS